MQEDLGIEGHGCSRDSVPEISDVFEHYSLRPGTCVGGKRFLAVVMCVLNAFMCIEKSGNTVAGWIQQRHIVLVPGVTYYHP